MDSSKGYTSPSEEGLGRGLHERHFGATNRLPQRPGCQDVHPWHPVDEDEVSRGCIYYGFDVLKLQKALEAEVVVFPTFNKD